MESSSRYDATPVGLRAQAGNFPIGDSPGGVLSVSPAVLIEDGPVTFWHLGRVVVSLGLQAGHGIPAPPQLQALDSFDAPPQGLSVWSSHTQKHPPHCFHDCADKYSARSRYR